MKLHTIPKSKGARPEPKCLGRGQGTGHGKTSGRGHKGGKARAGYTPSPVCSGIPYYRKLPKRGFSNFSFTKRYDIVNVGDLSTIEGIQAIDRDVLVHAGLVRPTAVRIKVLGDGELSRALTITADKFSSSAKAKIEAAGGQVSVIEKIES
ncbi:MAG: 50S ribosomal protein L15 [Verrucomicrobia bacterium GWF2_51_19]|nr:MAG: 50S ribosomal protein L15 [Verrucomicrobia bacterium GWF2_51_19]HCJ12590.1 50S ribosomal protein L15 [Opitutae bacterium]